MEKYYSSKVAIEATQKYYDALDVIANPLSSKKEKEYAYEVFYDFLCCVVPYPVDKVNDIHFKCPTCSSYIPEGYTIMISNEYTDLPYESTYTDLKYTVKYCPQCGQKLWWEDK